MSLPDPQIICTCMPVSLLPESTVIGSRKVACEECEALVWASPNSREAHDQHSGRYLCLHCSMALIREEAPKGNVEHVGPVGEYLKRKESKDIE